MQMSIAEILIEIPLSIWLPIQVSDTSHLMLFTKRYAFHFFHSDEYNIVETLIRAGADVNSRNNKGWTPFCRAHELGNIGK